MSYALTSRIPLLLVDNFMLFALVSTRQKFYKFMRLTKEQKYCLQRSIITLIKICTEILYKLKRYNKSLKKVIIF
jgi:hypothetical protein